MLDDRIQIDAGFALVALHARKEWAAEWMAAFHVLRNAQFDPN